MKAKIKPLIILIAIFAATLIAGVAAGCSIGENTPQDSADNRGMYSSVTYYANGGTFSDNAICYKTMYFVPGNPIFNIGMDAHPVGGSGSELSITRTNMMFAGWVYAELDGNGLPTLLKMNENGEITGEVLQLKDNGSASITNDDGRELSEQQKRFTAKISEDPDEWDFAFENGRPTLEKGEHIYLVAAWMPDVKLDYVLIADEEVTFEFPKADDPETEEDESKQTEEVVLTSGDVIKSDGFGVAGYNTLKPASAPAVATSNHSFIYLFWDEECTLPVTSKNGHMGSQQYGPFTVERPQDGVNAKIYAKYMSGIWTTVADSSAARNMFNQLGSNNYYLVDDIDCSAQSLSLSSRTFSGTIMGNGYTISNLNLSSGTLANGATVSLFGTATATAKISDLTISNVKATVSLAANRNANVYALFASCDADATFKDFSVVGYSMSITCPESATIMNIQLLNDGYDTTNWLYGGNSDAEFISVHGNIITNVALTINNQSIIGQEDSNE